MPAYDSGLSLRFTFVGGAMIAIPIWAKIVMCLVCDPFCVPRDDIDAYVTIRFEEHDFERVHIHTIVSGWEQTITGLDALTLAIRTRPTYIF